MKKLTLILNFVLMSIFGYSQTVNETGKFIKLIPINNLNNNPFTSSGKLYIYDDRNDISPNGFFSFGSEPDHDTDMDWFIESSYWTSDTTKVYATSSVAGKEDWTFTIVNNKPISVIYTPTKITYDKIS